jgi:hypothetical protein
MSRFSVKKPTKATAKDAAKNKACAVYASPDNGTGENRPASIVRNHGNATLYADREPGARLAEIQGLKNV